MTTYYTCDFGSQCWKWILTIHLAFEMLGNGRFSKKASGIHLKISNGHDEQERIRALFCMEIFHDLFDFVDCAENGLPRIREGQTNIQHLLNKFSCGNGYRALIYARLRGRYMKSWWTATS